MKKFRKIMAVLVAAMMIMAMMVPAMVPAMVWAARTEDGSITVDNAIPNETYELYKIFDLTYATPPTSGSDNTVVTPTPGAGTENQNTITGSYKPVAYYYNKEDETDNFLTDLLSGTGKTYFTVTQIGGSNTYTVEKKAAATDANIIDYIKNNLNKLPASKKISPPKPAPAASEGHTRSSVSWDNLAYGYYYVTSTAGSLITIDSTMKNATVKEKNTLPISGKTVENSASTGNWVNSDNAEIGDTVNFEISIKDGKGTNNYIVLHDTMTDGLTLIKKSFAVTKNGAPVETNNFTIYVDKELSMDEVSGTSVVPVTTTYDLANTDIRANMEDANSTLIHGRDSDTFIVAFNPAYVSTLTDTEEVIVSYSARLNENAKYSADQTNTSHITYSNQFTPDSTVSVKTYKVDVLKYAQDASTTPLAGAVLQLQDSSGNPIWLIKDTTGDSSFDCYKISEKQDFATAPTGYTAQYEAKDNSILTSYKETSGTGQYYRAVVTGSKKVRIDGLDVDVDYLLEELEAPDGYYQKTAKIEVKSNQTKTEFPQVDIENVPGTELPATGGMGTTVLYIVGGMLVVLAGAYLFFSRKKTA